MPASLLAALPPMSSHVLLVIIANLSSSIYPHSHHDEESETFRKGGSIVLSILSTASDVTPLQLHETRPRCCCSWSSSSPKAGARPPFFEIPPPLPSWPHAPPPKRYSSVPTGPSGPEDPYDPPPCSIAIQ
ncbi:hypothetical protein QBC32DRAFT_334090 [Pseudoneurospora amorphoporcata]|uniref:Uncharacterized protein n=1 Tax=Pseudoneurospora amorphoporcata TaxID=241081 RepID=A0AAN6SJE0_9PEZI|nr:hypothetical protein QBC32DRAFT_334090 [Pseudoneurospora amorphoporcata]